MMVKRTDVLHEFEGSAESPREFQRSLKHIAKEDVVRRMLVQEAT